MSKKVLLLITIIITSCLPTVVSSKKNESNVTFHNYCKQIKSSELCDRSLKYLSQKDKRDSAFVCYTIVANRYNEGCRSKEDIRLAVKALYNLGVMHVSFYVDYEKAMEYLLQAEHLAEEGGIDEAMANICYTLANIMLMIDDGVTNKEEQALDLMKKGFRYAQKQNDNNDKSLVLNGLISYAAKTQKEKDILSELSVYEKDVALDTQPITKYTKIRCHAIQEALKNHRLEAAHLMEEAADIKWNQLLQSRFRITTLNDATQYYLQEKSYKNALATCERSLQIIRNNEGSETDYYESIYATLMKIYAGMGDSVLAQRYDYLRLKARDSLLSQGRLQRAGSVELRQQLARLDFDMQRMSERQRTLTIFFVLALTVALLVSFLLWRLFRAYRKLRDAHRHLYEQNLEQLKQDELHRQLPQPKIGMDESEEQQLMDRVISVLQNNDEIYNVGFTINRMAELVDSNHKYVSQAVNNITGHNFSTLLANYRVKEACRRLNDRQTYGNMTIEAVAESVGIKSRSNFTVVFKRQTGLTPSEYLRMAKDKTL